MGFFIELLKTIIVLLGFSIPKIDLFFNKPKLDIDKKIIYNLHADIIFDGREKKLISSACKEISFFTNNSIIFNIIYDIKFEKFISEKLIYEPKLLKFSSKENIIKESDDFFNSKILGLFYIRPIYETNEIYLVYDRLKNNIRFKSTLMHEMGHFVGISHIDYPSIMHKYNDGILENFTYLDAIEFSKILECEPEDLRYLK